MVNASKWISKFEKNPKNKTKIELMVLHKLSSNTLTPGEVSFIKWIQYQIQHYQVNNEVIVFILSSIDVLKALYATTTANKIYLKNLIDFTYFIDFVCIYCVI
eukprot:5991_1